MTPVCHDDQVKGIRLDGGRMKDASNIKVGLDALDMRDASRKVKGEAITKKYVANSFEASGSLENTHSLILWEVG